MGSEALRQSEYTPSANELTEVYTQVQAIRNLDIGRVRHRFLRQKIEDGFRRTGNFSLFDLPASRFSRITIYSPSDFDADSKVKLFSDTEAINALVEMWTPKFLSFQGEQVFVGLINEGEEGVRAFQLTIDDGVIQPISEQNFKALKEAIHCFYDKESKQQPIEYGALESTFPRSSQLRS